MKGSSLHPSNELFLAIFKVQPSVPGNLRDSQTLSRA